MYNAGMNDDEITLALVSEVTEKWAAFVAAQAAERKARDARQCAEASHKEAERELRRMVAHRSAGEAYEPTDASVRAGRAETIRQSLFWGEPR